MKKIVTLTAVVLAVTAASTYAEDIGVVNMKKIFSASPKVKQIKSDLTKQFASQKMILKKWALLCSLICKNTKKIKQ